MSLPRIALYYEHPEWFTPLIRTLEQRPVELLRQRAEMHCFDPVVSEPGFDLLVNRMSPSSYTRGNGNGLFYTGAYLEYVEGLGLPVVNGLQAHRLEISKARQLLLMERLGVRYPRSRVINHPSQAVAASQGLIFPVVVKANIGGSGAGIALFENRDELASAVADNLVDLGLDQTALVQEFHTPENGFIVRVEFLDGAYLYAIEVESNPADGFNLCPADACAVPGEEVSQSVELDADFCPVEAPTKRQVRAVQPPKEIVAQVLRLGEMGGLDIGGIEYLVSSRDGLPYFYDINALSNFVAGAPQLIGFDPFDNFADYLVRRATVQVGKRTRSAV